MQGNIVLFEDHLLDEMRPVTLTKPAFAVTCGCHALWEVAPLAADRVSFIVRDYVQNMAEACLEPQVPGAGPTLFLNASVAPDVDYIETMRDMLQAGDPVLCTSGERVAAALLPEDGDIPEELGAEEVTSYLLSLDLPLCGEDTFTTIDYPFEIVKYAPQLFERSLERRLEDGNYEEVRPGLFVGDAVHISERAVFHTEGGPVVLEDGVEVGDFSYLQGPVYVGADSRVIERSSVKEMTYIGHTCKVGGEVEESTIEAYSNKQHHGFLGHAYVGSWVNLGAGTSNSDLKNTYGEIRVWHRGRKMDTGMQFLGCIMGDYVKSAINTSIFTGKIIGTNSMLYGLVGNNVPSFTNYARWFDQVTEVPLEQAITTQRRMFDRRGVEQTEEDIELLRRAFELTQDERQMPDEPPVI